MSNGYDEGLRRHAMNLTTAGIGMVDNGRKPPDKAAALVEASAIVERYLRTGQVEPHPFKVGDLTRAHLFEAAGLQNLSDLQAVLDAAEAALVAATVKPVGPYQLNVPWLGTATVLVDVVLERQRQVGKGWSNDTDDTRTEQQLAACAGFAILPIHLRRDVAAPCWIAPDSRRDELVKGIAMAVAEVERLDRLPQPAVAAAFDPESRTHGDSSAIDDEAPLAMRPVEQAEGPARTLTTQDIPHIVREAVLTAAAQLQRSDQGPRQVHGRDALG